MRYASHRPPSLRAVIVQHVPIAPQLRYGALGLAQLASSLPPYESHSLACIPSGGVVSTFPLLTSSQFVLNAVPLLSV